MGGFAGYCHFCGPGLLYSPALAKNLPLLQSYALFVTGTQGSAKPPPWAESSNRFAVNPTGFWAESCNRFAVNQTGSQGGAPARRLKGLSLQGKDLSRRDSVKVAQYEVLGTKQKDTSVP
jgi:hypothetical protein